jgi:hypothetical protein
MTVKGISKHLQIGISLIDLVDKRNISPEHDEASACSPLGATQPSDPCSEDDAAADHTASTCSAASVSTFAARQSSIGSDFGNLCDHGDLTSVGWCIRQDFRNFTVPDTP